MKEFIQEKNNYNAKHVTKPFHDHHISNTMIKPQKCYKAFSHLTQFLKTSKLLKVYLVTKDLVVNKALAKSAI